MTQTKTKIQILRAFKELYNPKWRYIVYHGGRASGKSTSTATALLIRGRKKKLRILCTREYQNSIADSVHKLLKDLIEKYDFAEYEVTKDRIINTVTGTEFIFRGLHNNITEIKSTEGVDICWVEEAQSLTKESIDILTPTIRKNGSQIIFTFNRLFELDPVYVEFVINKPENTYVAKRNYDVLERAGLLPDVIKLEIEKDINNPDVFNHKWLGEPISQSEKSIISRTQVVEAMQRKIEADGQIEFGVDVARMGSDRTVFWKRKGLKTIKFDVHNGLRTTEVCDLLEQFVETKEQRENEYGELEEVDISKELQIKIDDTGVGGGVTDEMIRRGYNVVPINFGAKAGDEDKYPNWISEAWFHMREIMSEAELPFDDNLLMELTTREWAQDEKGKRRVESKVQYKKRGFRSPDLADACIICYAKPTNFVTLNDIAM